MSNLVPTPRVDKNGRVTTRHMKPESTPVSTPLSVSKPTLGGSGKQTMSDKEFLVYLDPNNRDYVEHDEYQNALQDIMEHSPSVMDDVTALLKLGNENGSFAIRAFLQENLDTLVYQYTYRGERITERIDGYEDSTDSLKEALSIHWAIGSLSAETDSFFNSFNTGARAAIEVSRSIRSDYGDRDYDSDVSYWRAVGVTALLTGPMTKAEYRSEDQARKSRELVQWMEPMEYLGDIMRVGMERRFKDVESIKAILDSDAPSSLSSGTL